MTAQEQIKRLFKLVELSHELGDLVDLKLIDQWNTIREEYGLAQTLTLIKQYVKDTPSTTNQKSELKDNTATKTLKTQHTNQNPSLVQ
jgi:hypothetical protein